MLRPATAGADLPDANPPRATYRVQLHAGFTFDDAAAQAEYLARLGISHLYCSPVLQAAPGSTHGYDVVDPTRVSADLGGDDGHARLGAALGAVGIGQIVDVVPNHMAITGRENTWWWDVLANGPSSVYAGYFDVDWGSPDPRLHNTVLLPILGDHYGRELEAGRIVLARDGSDLILRYFDHAAPLDPSSLDTVFLGAARRMPAEPEEARLDLERLAGFVARLPPAASTDADDVDARHRGGETLRSRLGELAAAHPAALAAVDEELAALNADVDALDVLISRQNYRLAWWRSAGENLDYRRFFDINDLAAIRVEEPRVFADSHWLILDWLARGVIDGVRVDHIDGLYDPRRYLDRLAAGAERGWVLVEKILEGDERLPDSWPVDGTTGYEWLNRVGDLFTYEPGWQKVVAAYHGWIGSETHYEEIAYRAKLAVLNGSLAADLNRLVTKLAAVCEHHRRQRDHTRRDLHDALVEVAAGYGVYRTYLAGDDSGADAGVAVTAVAAPRDVEVVTNAVLVAGLRRPDLDEHLLEFVRAVLLGQVPGEAETEVALRFQQLTGPVMAKAVEDTAFYRYLPLTSLNEVGGDPSRVEADLERFHAACAEAQARRPGAMLTTSTHDTKRSEDVRARICVLAEVPDEWAAALDSWWEAVADVSGIAPPDRNTAWLLLQTLVGAWPISTDRAVAYLEKATREAKEHTSWTEPDPIYDEMTRAFAAAVVDHPATEAAVTGLLGRIDRPGRAVALGLKLLTLTAPGIPDLYQGSELWDLSLVDPDNRRPVDYALRQRLLEQARSVTAAAAWAGDDPHGLVKLCVVSAALEARREVPAAFGAGATYTPLQAEGPAAEHLVAFGRGDRDGVRVIVVATRWPVVLDQAGGWGTTVLELPPGRWTDRCSGAVWSGSVAVADLLAGLPVGLLVAGGTGRG